MTDILEKIGSFTSTIGAEITAYDPQSQELFIVSGDTEVQVIDFSDPTNPTQAIPPIDIATLTSGIGGANSIAVSNGLLAIALAAETVTNPGSIVVVDIAAFRNNPGDASTFKVLEVGSLPDMVTFTPDGTKLLVANEAEPDDSIDPESSISIIDLSAGLANLSQENVATADFTAFNGREEELRNKGVRIFPDKTVAEDVEPEFIAVSPDGKSAFVTLQENNAFAVLDLESAQVVDILPLGVKDHSQGQPSLEQFEFTDLPTLGITEAGQEIKLGGLSGLFYEGTDETTGKLKFITVPDRGPNGEPTDVDGDGSNERPFALPDYQARAIRFELEPNSGEISITETIFLTRPDGTTPITGRPNIAGIDEEPVDLSGNLLSLDEFGADLEGIVVASDSTFWMVDEYRPAIYHFDSQGVLIERLVPEGISALAGATEGTFGTESLPSEYSNRRSNRGFEAVSLDTETGILYAFIQTPLANPDRATSDNSDVIRILGIDTTTGNPVAEYVYLLEDSASDARPGGRVDKIGDATYAGDGKFFIIERDAAVGETAKKFIFEIDLKGATNLLAADAPALPADSTLEQLGNADQLAAVGIQAVNKIKVTNVPSIGYLAGDKPEGLALLDDGKLAVLNDNDFGLLDQEIPVDGSVPLNPNPTPVILGIIDFDTNNGFDASDRDDAINIQNHPVFGLYQPDSIASFEANGNTYYVTANEGDARDEDERIKDLTLDPEAFPDAENLQQDEQLGRLQVSTIDGDLDGDGDFDQLFSYGGRSFSIWDEFGNQVFDSGNDLEQITAQQIPELFNSEGVIDDEEGFDSRSDNKGPEPEGVTTGVINNRTYAFIGLERTGGIAAYEVTNPTAPQFVQYLPNDDGGDPTNPVDRAPEGLTFISAEDSPNGEPLLVVANEDSQTLSVLSVDPGTRISDIQGAGHTSPLEGQAVTSVPGIVTALDSNGFYLQDPNPDNSDATSEGIFVFTGSAPTVSIGDQIEVSGTVSEFTPGGTDTGNLSITQITSPEVTLLSSNNPLPASVILGVEGRTSPTEIVDNDNFAVFDPQEDGIDFYESLEGMRVTIDNPVAISPTNRFGEIWTVTDNGTLATPGLNSRGGIQLGAEDTNPERIQVQLDSGVLPDFEAAVNLGDSLSDVTGVVSYSFGNFEVTATEPFEINDSGLQPEVTSLVGSDDQLTIASYNLLNLDPSDTEQIAQIAEQITNNLQSPDILALQEIQDNSGSADDGVTASDQTLQALADAIADAGGSNYQFFDVPPADGSSGGQPVGNIRVAYLYDPTRVSLDEQSIQSLDVPAFDQSRDPLVADFSFNGNSVTVINNHFTSRFGSSPIFGSIQPFIEAGEDERNAQAEFLNDFVDGIIAEDADANVVVLGDLNTFEFTGTLSLLAGEGDEQVLNNLVNTLDGDTANTFNFQGNSQVLDHAFVSNSLLEGAEFDIVNLNIDFAEQASDHDPIIARLNLPSDSSTEDAFKLQILHAGDQEGGLTAIVDAVNFSAVINGLENDFENTLKLSSGDIYIPGPFFNASDEVFGWSGIGDILINNAIGFQAVAFGNHEFDLGPGTVSDLIRVNGEIGPPNPEITFTEIEGVNISEGTAFPYLSGNLDFSQDLNLADLVVPDGQAPLPNSIAGSVVIEVGGESIGVVGATTPSLPSLSSIGDVVVSPADDTDFVALAAEIQEDVDALTSQGIDKVVLVSHMQQIGIEQQLAGLLTDVDVIIAGGSNTILANDDDPLRDGDVSQGVYPLELTSASGEPVAVVNTDGNYRYVGRLVVDFDQNGLITSIGDESGAYATDDAGVDRVFGEDVDASEVADPIVVAVTDAISNNVSERDGNLFGRTDVFLNGTRGDVRTQETNLGNLTADANLFAAKNFDASVTVSIKNGGGIRDNIGVATIPAGSNSSELELSPPAANPLVGKEEGEISQLDIENTLRFNNELTLLTVSAEELKQILEHGVAATETGATPGQFPQVGGIAFSFDSEEQAIAFDDAGNVITEGERIRSLAILNEDGTIADVIVSDGELAGDANREIRLVTLDFLANGGDNYPFPFFGEDRVDLATALTEAGEADFTAPGTEQDALAEFLAVNFPADDDAATPMFTVEDAIPTEDLRIQNLSVRDDQVLGTDGGDIVDEMLVGTGESEEIAAGAGNDTVAGGLGDDQIFGNDGDDVLRGDQNNRSPGSTIGGDDTIFGGAGNDRIGGKAGNDQLFGEEGDDQIWGDDGDDLISGGKGNDTLTGDDFSGGKGSDTFVLAIGEGTDTIVDFGIGEDFIALADSLSFGQLSITENGSNTLISFEDKALAILNDVNANELTDTSFTVI